MTDDCPDCARLTAERDEARDAAGAYQRSADYWRDKLDAALDERDAARAKAGGA